MYYEIFYSIIDSDLSDYGGSPHFHSTETDRTEAEETVKELQKQGYAAWFDTVEVL